MLPLAGDDRLWRNGLAGAIPAAAAFVIAAAFLFFAARLAFDSVQAGVAAALLFALNPNALYLQATAMTEPFFFAALAALLYFSILFQRTQSLLATAAAGVAACAATLTRYEGWLLIPLVTIYFAMIGRPHRWRGALLFTALAAAGPLAWLAHNGYYYSNFLEFYNGPYSAKAIYARGLAQGQRPYPGDGDWRAAFFYFREAAALCAGQPLLWLAAAGGLVALVRRVWWPLVVLALPPLFYILSLHSGGTPIFMPHLEPNSYYNTRYGLAALPLLAFAAAALTSFGAEKLRAILAVLVIVGGAGAWLLSPSPENWITWKESQVNSVARRTWTAEAARHLAREYQAGTGILATFGDVSGVFREAGIPLQETLNECDDLIFEAAVARPDLFLREEWAVAIEGDPVDRALARSARTGPVFRCVRMIHTPGAPPVRIFRRDRARTQ